MPYSTSAPAKLCHFTSIMQSLSVLSVAYSLQSRGIMTPQIYEGVPIRRWIGGLGMALVHLAWNIYIIML